MWRSRWAALGAAVAVSLGGGGFFLASAAPGPAESTIVSVTPTRVLDTRDPVNVGLPGPFASPVSQKLQVTGSIPTTSGAAVVVPAGATGVLLNVTAVGPTANGFVSIRPGDATGAPATSSLNVEAGSNLPNAVQVALPTSGANAGQIDITYDAYGTPGPTTELLIDVVGYMTNTGLQELVADVATRANGFVAREPNTLEFGPVSTDQVAAELALPAGSFVITAKLVANNNTAAAQSVGCELRLGATVIDGLTFPASFFLEPDPGADKAVISFTSSGTLAAPGTASVVCRTTANAGNYYARSITAIQVAGVTGTASDAPLVAADPD